VSSASLGPHPPNSIGIINFACAPSMGTLDYPGVRYVMAVVVNKKKPTEEIGRKKGNGPKIPKRLQERENVSRS